MGLSPTGHVGKLIRIRKRWELRMNELDWAMVETATFGIKVALIGNKLIS